MVPEAVIVPEPVRAQQPACVGVLVTEITVVGSSLLGTPVVIFHRFIGIKVNSVIGGYGKMFKDGIIDIQVACTFKFLVVRKIVL